MSLRLKRECSARQPCNKKYCGHECITAYASTVATSALAHTRVLWPRVQYRIHGAAPSVLRNSIRFSAVRTATVRCLHESPMQSRKVAVPKSATSALRSEWPRQGRRSACGRCDRGQLRSGYVMGAVESNMAWHGTPLGDGATEAGFRVSHTDFIPARTPSQLDSVQAIRARHKARSSVDGNSKDVL